MTLSALNATGCGESEVEAPTADAGAARVVADVTVGDIEVEADGAATSGMFGHCCVESVLVSCFCPAGAICDFGMACPDGGCATADAACTPALDARRD